MSILGRSGEPTATTVAWVEPETAPNRVQEAAVETARPPFTWPMKDITMSISRSADWPRVMMSAARMNIGTAISEAGRMPAIICWIRVSIWPRPLNIMKKPITAAVISGIIIGKPSSSSPIMVVTIIVVIVRSPGRTALRQTSVSVSL